MLQMRDCSLGLLTDDGILLEDVVGSIHDGVVVVNRSGKIIFANPSYSRIMGIPVGEAIGRYMRDVTPRAHTLKVLATGEPLLNDTHYSEHLGIDVVMSATPIVRHGELMGVVTVFRTSQEMLELYAGYRRAHGLPDYSARAYLQPAEKVAGFDRIVGQSGPMAQVVKLAARVARTDASVLVTGENGVGKDVLCQAIHEASGRKGRPYVVVNCAAIPETLLESELFGFDQGSFTGASRTGKLGKFELADGGTLFLDEIGDMNLAMQSKLLRALQNGEVQRIGSSKTVRVDVRVLAATNQPLERMIAQGRFREDLYYRINVFPIEVPPLRERAGEIAELARHFLDQLCTEYKRGFTLAPETFDALERYRWPGNIRQLRNVLERACILCEGAVILPEHVQGIAAPGPMLGARRALRDEVRTVERQSFEAAIKAAGGNKSRAMRSLGVSRRTFYKKLKAFGLFGEADPAG